MIKKFTLFCLFLFSLNVSFSTSVTHQPVVFELVDLMNSKPEIKKMLIESIAIAQKKVPNKKYNPVQSLDEFLEYADVYAHSLPGEMPPGNLFSKPGSVTRESVHQNLMYFYFLINQPLDDLKKSGYYKNTLQYYPPFTNWLLKLSSAKGSFLSSQDSWNDKTYNKYREDKSFNLYKGWYGNKNIWKSYNDFFSRSLVAGARPITLIDNDSIVVSPSDSIPQGVWTISNKNLINIENGLKFKFIKYYKVNELLKGSRYSGAFKNGYLTHTYLNVNDFHRYIFPVGGEVKDKNIIIQNFSLDVYWDKVKNKYALNTGTGWQFSETRGYVIVNTKKYGLVAIIPIGMEQVSSINFEENIKIGSIFNKGDKLGYFAFGASDIVMLFQNQSHFVIDAPKDIDNHFEHILAGQKYGVMGEQPKSS